jgi:hypothetical protein
MPRGDLPPSHASTQMEGWRSQLSPLLGPVFSDPLRVLGRLTATGDKAGKEAAPAPAPARAASAAPAAGAPKPDVLAAANRGVKRAAPGKPPAPKRATVLK